MKKLFLDFFPNHVYRYLDQTGNGRPAISSKTRRDDLNEQGYCAYFSVNGFIGDNAKLESCSNLNAFYVDIDGRKDKEELEEIKKRLQPTFIIETGAGHHLYWVISEPIYKEDCFGNEWEEYLERYEKIERNIVRTLKGDPKCQDVPRILRIPGTLYWKESGDKYKEGFDGVFKIKGIEKKEGARYTIEEIEEAFPQLEEAITRPSTSSNLKKYADDERTDFFNRINKQYPIEDRPSFKALISGKPETLPQAHQRNHALLITASLMRDAGWKKEKAIEKIKENGWHGIEKERGGMSEIVKTINSAYANGYRYSYKNEIISHNMTPEEQREIQIAYTEVAKIKKDTDKIRYTNYEREILINYPYLRKNEIGIIFNYDRGVYRMLSDLQVSDIVLNGLYDDMLWNFRTKKSVADKVACLLSIIPPLELTNDGGYILNLKNGLLNLNTRELRNHSPDFVSLVQFPVEYDPNAVCPVWEACMEAWTVGEECEEKKTLLKQFSGYLLSSSMQYDKALFLVGDGGAGKSTFIDTLARVLGDQSVSHIDLEGLYGQYGMKGLIGKRLNVIEEVEGNFYHSNKLKKLISGEPVTIDMKYKDQFTFTPQAKFVFAVNLIPRIDDSSTATERRMLVVNFKNNFQENPNTALRSSMGLLADELSGILNWMIEGAHLLKASGRFITTTEQTELLAEYRMENSSVEGFIGECLEFGEGYSVGTRELYDEYKTYCGKDGRKFKSHISFNKEMKTYGGKKKKFFFEPRQHGSDISKFVGVRIVDNWSQERRVQVEYNSF